MNANERKGAMAEPGPGPGGTAARSALQAAAAALLAEARAHGYQASLARLDAEREWHQGHKARLYRERVHHERLMTLAEQHAYRLMDRAEPRTPNSEPRTPN
jgi:hypothetical protein